MLGDGKLLSKITSPYGWFVEFKLFNQTRDGMAGGTRSTGEGEHQASKSHRQIVLNPNKNRLGTRSDQPEHRHPWSISITKAIEAHRPLPICHSLHTTRSLASATCLHPPFSFLQPSWYVSQPSYMRIKPFIISSISVPSPHSLISNIILRLKNYWLCGSIDFALMADLRDEHGNPIQLTDQHGNPVQLTDEHGNPMHLTGVASTHPITTTTAAPVHDADALKTTGESHLPTSGHGTADQAVHGGAPVAAEPAEGGGGEVHHEKRESSSSSSSVNIEILN